MKERGTSSWKRMASRCKKQPRLNHVHRAHSSTAVHIYPATVVCSIQCHLPPLPRSSTKSTSRERIQLRSRWEESPTSKFSEWRTAWNKEDDGSEREREKEREKGDGRKERDFRGKRTRKKANSCFIFFVKHRQSTIGAEQ